MCEDLHDIKQEIQVLDSQTKVLGGQNKVLSEMQAQIAELTDILSAFFGSQVGGFSCVLTRSCMF